MDITAERVRELLHYDASTGRFTWLQRRGNDRLTNSWNARYAGTEAGSFEPRKGYVFISIDDVGRNAARLAWLYVHGRWPTETIDHINGVRTDNRLINLREASFAENARNKRCAGRSGLKGAYRYPEHGAYKWRAVIRSDGQIHRLGTFETAEAAHAAYCEAAAKLHGEFARFA